jgi:hypothetical protein
VGGLFFSKKHPHKTQKPSLKTLGSHLQTEILMENRFDQKEQWISDQKQRNDEIERIAVGKQPF